MKTVIKRYFAYDFDGKEIARGSTIASVDGAGDRIIVDYKLLRFTCHALYPLSVYLWIRGLREVGNFIRRRR